MGIIDTDVETWLMLNVGDVVARRRLGGSGWTSTSVYEIKRVRAAANESEFASYFVKTSDRMVGDVFEGEAFGLNAMHATNTVKVPKARPPHLVCSQKASASCLHPVCVLSAHRALPIPWAAAQVLRFADGSSSGSYIIMDHLALKIGLEQNLFGRQMAQMHLATPLAPQAREGRFGFPVTNRIGDTVQPNAWYLDWVDFFREQVRLLRQPGRQQPGRQQPGR